MLKDNGNFNIVWKVTEEEIANTSDNDKCVALITVNKPINEAILNQYKSVKAVLVAFTGYGIHDLDLCKERNIWLHIDGSIGGIFAITSIPIEGLNNINQANSITINPQKIIGITKTSSLLLVSNMSTLENTFNTIYNNIFLVFKEKEVFSFLKTK